MNNDKNNLPTHPLHVVGIGGTLREHSSSLIALRRALAAAEGSGATTDLLDLKTLDLPMYQPGLAENAQPSVAHEFIDRVQRADALLWSTAAYHGTLAGVTKNALDYLEALSSGPQPYLDGRVIGLIATAGGEIAGVNALNAMVHAVHALRGTVAPLLVPIPQAYEHIDRTQGTIAAPWGEKLDNLGRLVVSMTRDRQPHPVNQPKTLASV